MLRQEDSKICLRSNLETMFLSEVLKFIMDIYFVRGQVYKFGTKLLSWIYTLGSFIFALAIIVVFIEWMIVCSIFFVYLGDLLAFRNVFNIVFMS